MTKLFFIAALTGIILQWSGKIYAFINFELNKEYIAKELCIRKNEPDNCCKGKCYLEAQLEEEEEKEKKPLPQIEKKEEIKVCQSRLNFKLLISEIGKSITRYCQSVQQEVESSIFRPPKNEGENLKFIHPFNLKI